MAEHRRLPRRRVYYGARIEFDNRSTLDCLVRDMSADGARLKACSSGVQLPDRFSLFVPKQCATYEAKIAWRQEDAIGVKLLARQTHDNIVFFDPLRRRER